MKSLIRYGALAIAIAIAAIWWTKPGHIELDIPVAAHKGGGPFWWEKQRSELAYADSAGVLYLNRRVGTAYPETHDWNTVEEVLAFFDTQLAQRGWSRPEGSSGANPNCRKAVCCPTAPQALHAHRAVQTGAGSPGRGLADRQRHRQRLSRRADHHEPFAA